jgi:ribosomal protein S18 acetylase RimI-like enzyme
MNIRKIRLPQDIDDLAEVSLASFKYPENPEWNIQEDETEELEDQLKAIKRFWPLVRLGMLFSPMLRHLFMGYLCEEDGKIVGALMHQRRMSTDVCYYITNVAVHPDYRRRGIARRVVETALEEMRASGGKKVMLDVIAGNLPAYRLYEQLGWVHFSGTVHLDLDAVQPAVLPLPAGYEVIDLAPADWQTEFRFMQRITPQGVQRFDPVEETRFREGMVMRLLEPLTGVKRARAALRSSAGEIAALCGYRYRTRAGGINHARILVDPVHRDAAPFFVSHVTGRVQGLAPGRRLEAMAPSWLPDVTAAAQQAGYVRRYEYHSMGLFLDQR